MGTFVASMRLYQEEDGVHAFIRVQDEGGEEEEVLVPPHMAVMLPQAVAMIKSQTENG